MGKRPELIRREPRKTHRLKEYYRKDSDAPREAAAGDRAQASSLTDLRLDDAINVSGDLPMQQGIDRHKLMEQDHRPECQLK